MEFENYMDMLFDDSPAQMPDEVTGYDPGFEQRIALIQDAMAINGNFSAPPELLPEMYDDLLLELIDSVPLE